MWRLAADSGVYFLPGPVSSSPRARLHAHLPAEGRTGARQNSSATRSNAAPAPRTCTHSRLRMHRAAHKPPRRCNAHVPTMRTQPNPPPLPARRTPPLHQDHHKCHCETLSAARVQRPGPHGVVRSCSQSRPGQDPTQLNTTRRA